MVAYSPCPKKFGYCVAGVRVHSERAQDAVGCEDERDRTLRIPIDELIVLRLHLGEGEVILVSENDVVSDSQMSGCPCKAVKWIASLAVHGGQHSAAARFRILIDDLVCFGREFLP